MPRIVRCARWGVPRYQVCLDESWVLFGWSPLAGLCGVAFSAGLAAVVVSAEPLEVGGAVVVAWGDVVAVGAVCGAARSVGVGVFTEALGSVLDAVPECCPVGGEPGFAGRVLPLAWHQPLRLLRVAGSRVPVAGSPLLRWY